MEPRWPLPGNDRKTTYRNNNAVTNSNWFIYLDTGCIVQRQSPEEVGLLRFKGRKLRQK
jgi:hypothetical protein